MDNPHQKRKRAPAPEETKDEEIPEEEEESDLPCWREKCINEFGLLAVPEAWSDKVEDGSQYAWKQYHEYRSEQESIMRKHLKYEYDDDGSQELLKKWRTQMKWTVKEILDGDDEETNDDDDDDDDEQTDHSDDSDDDGDKKMASEDDNARKAQKEKEQKGDKNNKNKKWPTTLEVDDVAMEDMDEVRSVTLRCHVWSPYAIPHALHLEHRYHSRPRYNTFEFYATFGFKLLDMEDPSVSQNKNNYYDKKYFKPLCSDSYEDVQLRLDVIDVAHLNSHNMSRLQKFLFGTTPTKALQREMCSRLDFARLLFASMGMTDVDDYQTTFFGGDIGWAFAPSYNEPELVQQMEQAEIDNIPWLEFAIRKATNTLRPIDSHYRLPTVEDAPGYEPGKEEEREDADRKTAEQVLSLVLGEGNHLRVSEDFDHGKAVEELVAILRNKKY